jgi:hypothetical protein
MAELGTLYRRNITVIGISATLSYWLYKYKQKAISLTPSL